MTDPPSDPTARARHWLLTLGADRSRWPAKGRAEAEAAIALSPALRALEAEARSLDRALDCWAAPGPGTAGDAAALARILQHAETEIDARPACRPRPAGFGRPAAIAAGALAASIAVALLVAGPELLPEPAGPAHEELAADAFRLLYTPTSEEELPL